MIAKDFIFVSENVRHRQVGYGELLPKLKFDHGLVRIGSCREGYGEVGRDDISS